MPSYSPALDLILNLADKSSAGFLVLSGSQVIASPSASAASHRIVRADTRLARVRACVPNLSGERAFDDVDLAGKTVRFALGIPGEDPYCLATLDTPFPAADYQVTSRQSATAALPATKRITLDPAPYGGTWLLTLDDLDPIELPWNAEAAQILANTPALQYSIRRKAANAWEISGTEPGQDVAIAVDVSGLLVPVGVSGEIETNTQAVAAAFAALAAGTPPKEPKWLPVVREITIDGEPVFQDETPRVQLAREILNLTSLVPAPIPPSDYASLSALIAGKQPLSATLTLLAPLATTAPGRALLTKVDQAAILAYLSGQPLNAQLSAIALLVTAAYGRSLLTTSNPAAAKTLLLLDQVDNTSDADKPVSTAQAAADTTVADGAAAALASHAGLTNNPHGVIKAQVGLGSADNTSDADKPVSTAQTAAIQLVADDIADHSARTDNPHAVTKSQLGLGNVDNTSDASKPVSTAQAAADAAVASTAASALATHAGLTNNPHGVTKAQVGLGNADNTADASKPVSTAQAAADADVASTAASALATHAGLTNNPHGVTKAQVGLGNADNTADADKPVSTAQQTALDTKASLAGTNHFTGSNRFDAIQAFNLALDKLSDPGAPIVTPIGSDEGVTRSYKITALLIDGTETAAGPAGSSSHCDETLDGTNKVSLAWTAVPSAASYNVYRLENDGTSPATIGKIANVLTNAYVDTGAAGDGSVPPVRNSTGGVNGVLLHPYSTSSGVLYASKMGAMLDSNTAWGGGGGTDDTVVLQAAVDLLGILAPITGGTLDIDGAALISAPGLKVPSNVTLRCANKTSGVFMANGSNCHMVTNSNFTGTANPAEPSTGQRQRNISIIGGTWNHNFAGQSYHVGNNVANRGNCGMWFNGVDNLRLENVTIFDARVFCLMLTFPGRTDVIDYTAEYPVKRLTNNDTIHIWGPLYGDIYVRNLRAIRTCDDVFAFNLCESAEPGNGGTVFGGRAANDYRIHVDGAYLEDVDAIGRLDGSAASAGIVDIRGVVCRFSDAGGGTISFNFYGACKRFTFQDFDIEVPAGVPDGVPKGFAITSPRDGAEICIGPGHFRGDSSISTSSSQNNAFVTIILNDVATPAHKVVLDRVTASKPTPSRSGALVVVTGGATASQRALDQIQMLHCELAGTGFGFLYANDIGQSVVGTIETGNTNRLNGAQGSTGLMPLSVPDRDALSIAEARLLTGATVSVAHNTPRSIPFNTVDYDSAVLYDPTHPTRLTAKSRGTYSVRAHIPFAQNSTGVRDIHFRLTNAGGTLDFPPDLRPAMVGDVHYAHLGDEFRLNTGDFLEVRANQTSGGDLLISADAVFSMIRVR
jgi:hypothetical protein